MITSDSVKGNCPICSAPGHACGDDHVRYGPLDIPEKGETMADPVELKEYEYMVGNVPTTAMLTEQLAERLGAKPVGQADNANGGHSIEQNQAVLGSTAMRESDDNGVVDDNDSIGKQRTARNKRA